MKQNMHIHDSIDINNIYMYTGIIKSKYSFQIIPVFVHKKWKHAFTHCIAHCTCKNNLRMPLLDWLKR